MWSGWLLITLVLISSNILNAQIQPVPTTIEDFFLPGSQPGESGNVDLPSQCINCHGEYDQPVEPYYNWQGCMMAHALRDPLFEASMVIANQDAPESGDLCIRCHSPGGWLGGRSEPTDGSLLTIEDRESVHCMVCHRMVKPASYEENPYPNDSIYTADTYPADQLYISSITNPPDSSANGMYIIDVDQARRGPYSDAEATHQMLYSPFHSQSDICGTCHDVSNPVYTLNQDKKYIPNTMGQAAPDFNPYTMFPVERTYSEWKMSAYNRRGGVISSVFGGNKPYVSSCQDCHMQDITGKGCNKTKAPVRNDLPLHDLTGGNTFIPEIIKLLYPAEINTAALNSGIERARSLLQNAATLTTSLADNQLKVRVINETGHKLPSGYPEGRRMWLNVQAFDASGSLVYESCDYDSISAILNTLDWNGNPGKIYEIKPGISGSLSKVVNISAEPSFHFVLNDTIYKDNRVPPRGFTNTDFEAIQSPPVNYSYDDGQYWDESVFTVPVQSESLVVTLYYQTTSKEYIEFLRDENNTDNIGQDLYNL